MATPEHVIGIDLGTTNSCVAVVIDGEVHVIPDETGSRTQASVVAFLEDGSVMVGNEARKEMVSSPRHAVYSAKRLIGRHFHSSEIRTAILSFPYEVICGENDVPMIRVRGELYGLPEISGMVLRRMKDLAERYLGVPVGKAVITVPANFNDTQRQMTKLAGSLAGLDVLRVINEPTAAALAYGYGRDVNAKIAIYDFGGGTFDVTVLDIQGNVFEVVSTAGDSYLGGDDFDNRLARYMQLAFRQQHHRSIADDPVACGRLKQVAEKLKKELSRRERAIVNVHELAHDDAGNPLGLRFQVDRASVDQRWQDIVQRSFLVCDEALTAAKLKATDIDGVVLVGGTTRMPIVREMVEQYFHRQPLNDINPDEVVAVGAAIQGASLEADPFAEGAAEQPLLLDVTPLSLGVETVRGMFDVLIPRNASIPCDQTRVFTTTRDRQTNVKLKIYQGESRQAAENTKLGEIELYGLKPAARGQVQIEVTFEIDTDGMVVVTAKDRETGIEQAAKIQTAAGYSADEVQAMFERGI